MMSSVFKTLCSWDNLYLAWQNAKRDKRCKPDVAAFEFNAANELLTLQERLQSESWRPGNYRHFFIQEPKRRRISAAPFADRVVHHALMQTTAARFDKDFIGDSFANRIGKGTHAAVQRLKQLSQRHSYCLRLDVAQHFASIDHQILKALLRTRIPEDDVFALITLLVDSGCGIHQDHTPVLFAGDDLLDLARPTGLPMGNLTSQFWSNCYLDPVDKYIKRDLRLEGYVRYVDDMALFSNDKTLLREQGEQVRDFCANRLRLLLHKHSAHVQPCSAGTPWLGFVVYPTHIAVKARKVVESTRRLNHAYRAWQQGDATFEAFDAMVQGWIAHVQQGDTWGLRQHMLKNFDLQMPPQTP